MDDLSGLDWSTTQSKPIPKTTSTATSNAFAYPSLRPIPSPLTSGRNTPLSTQASGAAAFKPPVAKLAQDSFSNLVKFGPAKSTANLSLREQQERLEAEKRKKEEANRKQAQAHYGDGQFLDALGSGSNSRTASPAIPPPTRNAISRQNGRPTDSDDDLFAAFSADTKVDNASYYPPPAQNGSGKSTPANAPGLDLRQPGAWGQPAASGGNDFGDDDDPFGLNQLNPKDSKAAPVAATADDDDFLGDLARPVEEVRRKVEAQNAKPEPGKPIEDSSDSESEREAPPSNDPFDKAVAQLVEYGFSPENARRGLTESGGGLNVQAAVNWLLDDAHRRSKEKKAGGRQTSGARLAAPEDRQAGKARNSSPAWMREEGTPNRGNSVSPAQSDGDFTKTAAAVGSNLLKTAGSLWKTGQKKVQKAVQEFQQEPDSSQPKWMRSAQQDRMAGDVDKKRVDATDEAMMLESGGRTERGREWSANETRQRPESNTSSRNQSPAVRGASAPKWQQSSQPSLLDPRARLNKQAIEDEGAQAYISPARRKKSPQPPPAPQPEPDLLFNSTAPSRPNPSLPRRPAQMQAPSKPASQPRKAPESRPVRQIPSVNALALQSSAKNRAEGTAHFKRGDYAAAHISYSSSLTGIPSTHPLIIVLLCNRSLTALKTGEPRQAVADADTALSIIGPSKGEGESISLEDGTPEKRDMKDLYGKALTRKAEALEQMEKWADAGTVWQQCVESGVGGPTAIAGRQRCQKALAPKPAVKASPSPRPAARRPAAVQAKSSEAVDRLRAANKAAERADDEKFALTDKVDARIASWRDGKKDNLRALLGSMDQVLWEGSGWKKVGLHELVMVNKVKIHYMKAIAKTHPDKIPPDASTEVRMIAGTVFSTLNEAWDKFKAENGM